MILKVRWKNKKVVVFVFRANEEADEDVWASASVSRWFSMPLRSVSLSVLKHQYQDIESNSLSSSRYWLPLLKFMFHFCPIPLLLFQFDLHSPTRSCHHYKNSLEKYPKVVRSLQGIYELVLSMFVASVEKSLLMKDLGKFEDESKLAL